MSYIDIDSVVVYDNRVCWITFVKLSYWSFHCVLDLEIYCDRSVLSYVRGLDWILPVWGWKLPNSGHFECIQLVFEGYWRTPCAACFPAAYLFMTAVINKYATPARIWTTIFRCPAIALSLYKLHLPSYSCVYLSVNNFTTKIAGINVSIQSTNIQILQDESIWNTYNLKEHTVFLGP